MNQEFAKMNRKIVMSVFAFALVLPACEKPADKPADKGAAKDPKAATDADKAKTDKIVEPPKADPTKVEPPKEDPAKVEPGKEDPAKAGDAKADPAKEPAKDEPAKTGDAKTPAKGS